MLGEVQVPIGAFYGVHTLRAQENFPLTGRPPHPELVHAYGAVKLAAARTNRALGWWAGDTGKAEAIERACEELAAGKLDEHIVVDLMQGGAGTSLNMNVNEVVANRALELLGEPLGNYTRVSPMDDINLHQSTNDTYPTAMKLAAIRLLRLLENEVTALQEAFQDKEQEFAHVVKIGRTQLQDAVPTTLGREMGSYAEALGRDRWRICKCEERLRVVNLGGTAIGTGTAAPRQYIIRVVETLRDLTGVGFAGAENLVESTQNADAFVEVSGILKACASSLLKLSTDLRLMSSGPEAGFGEIRLPQRQAGSSIMPGKINPVIPEAASQVVMLVMGYDQTITLACSLGNLELNPFLPVVAACLLDSIELLSKALSILRRYCVVGIEADEERCRSYVLGSTALVTALVPVLGYEGASRVSKLAVERGATIREVVLAEGLLNEEQFEELISPDAVVRLGLPKPIDEDSEQS
jgi:aspartate ammonia-lyase